MKTLPLWLLACGIAAFAQNTGAGRGARGAARSPSPLSRLLQTLTEATTTDQAVRDVRTIWETDRWFTFPKFEETARNVAAIMRRAGLEGVEIGNAPADGVTQGGFWTEPLAWDVHVGTLEIVEPPLPADQRVLADYQKVPASLCMWSGPTPAGGVVAEVAGLSGNAAGNLESMDLKGKILLGQRGSKAALWKAGALGMISEATENRDLVDERGWVNSFGDNGWSFTKGSSPLVCFSITPRGSQLLRSLLQKGPVKVRANVDSHYYAGVYPYVTGLIRGTDGAGAEEVLSLGHLFEQGAHDNATGVASIIGAAETLNRLIREGRLPRPRRGIRVLGGANATAPCTTCSRTRTASREPWPPCASIRRRACRTWREPSTPGSSTLIPPSRSWMRFPFGSRRNTIPRPGARGRPKSTAAPPTTTWAIPRSASPP